ncbi:MAG: DUF1501 domain-containing protein [Planctomycetota bacterium]|nr:DUF1501 domain-containing protein [Planctomycetota bacterium]
MARFYQFKRRDMVRMVLASAAGASLSGWMPHLAAQVAEVKKQGRACILLWMGGGPSQLDTFDPKPGHKNGGPVKAIDTTVPGLQLSEYLPGLSKQAKDLVLFRGMTSKEGDHGRASQLMMTGYRPVEAVNYPGLGSLLAKELGQPDAELPGFVSISPFRFGGVGGPGFLGPRYAPLTVSGNSSDPNARADLTVENMLPPSHVSPDSMKSRLEMLQFLQQEFTSQVASDAAKVHQANYDRAIRMVETQGRNAFKLDEEPEVLRDAYGRNRFGQGCLLARRLIERGVPFVEVSLTNSGNVFGWDTHTDNFNQVKSLCDVLDPAWSTLMNDLRDRGMLETTTIVWMGEFGRTPVINDNGGRDHFPLAWSTVLAGGGLKGGQFVGNTGPAGAEVVDRPVQVKDFYATICQSLGINHQKENISTIGRPISIAEAGAEPVKEVLAG